MRHRTAEWSMLRVHASFVHSSLRRAMTTWVAYAEELRLAEEKARAVVVRLSPEGRALGRALNRWSEAGRRRRATLRALAAVVHRRTVAAVNTWRDAAADATARRRRLSSALHRMTPEGRAQARALARLAAGLEVRRRLRQGLAALCSRELRAAFVTLRDAAAAARRSRVLLTRALHSCLLHAIAAWRGAKPPPAGAPRRRRVDPPRAPRCVEPLGRPHQILGLRPPRRRPPPPPRALDGLGVVAGARRRPRADAPRRRRLPLRRPPPRRRQLVRSRGGAPPDAHADASRRLRDREWASQPRVSNVGRVEPPAQPTAPRGRALALELAQPRLWHVGRYGGGAARRDARDPADGVAWQSARAAAVGRLRG